MPQRKRRTYTAEQKAEAVNLVWEVGNLSKVSRDLGINASVLRNWVKQAEAALEDASENSVHLDERQELIRLRKEVKVLRMERDFAKKAAAFFAKDSKSSL